MTALIWFLFAGMMPSSTSDGLPRLFARSGDSPVIVFLLDGVGQPTFERLLQQGRLPNIQTLFGRNSIKVTTAVPSLPTETMTNLASILTGSFAGRHGIIGSEWRSGPGLDARTYAWTAQDLIFGRGSGKLIANEDVMAPTIFEALKPQETACVLTWLSNGCTIQANPIRSMVWGKLIGAGDLDRIAGNGYSGIIDQAVHKGRFPAFSFIHMIESDRTGHRSGIHTGQYEAAIVRADNRIGEIVSTFEKAGVLDRVIWVVTADHGMIDLRDYISPSALATKAQLPSGYKVSIGADRFTQFYWATPGPAGLQEAIHRLVEQEMVDVAAAKLNNKGIVIESRKNGPVPEEAQIRKLLENDRSGNVLVFAADGWAFQRINRGGHGGLTATELSVPLLIRGPGLISRTIPTAHTVDLMPTLLDLLGIGKSRTLDGRSLLN